MFTTTFIIKTARLRTKLLVTLKNPSSKKTTFATAVVILPLGFILLHPLPQRAVVSAADYVLNI